MDESPTERCLLSLPGEIREHIYTSYFALVHQHQTRLLSEHPDEPAILRTCRTMRHEALPLYYGACVLDTRIWVKCESRGSVWLTSRKWYHNLTNAQIAQFRIIKIHYCFVERYFGEPVEMIFTIKLAAQTKSFTHTFSFGPGWLSDVNRKGDPEDCVEVVHALRQNLVRRMDEAILQPGIGHLTASDIDSLAIFDPEILPY
jgi:hypothetical protein